jgi:hypothetical protein
MLYVIAYYLILFDGRLRCVNVRFDGQIKINFMKSELLLYEQNTHPLNNSCDWHIYIYNKGNTTDAVHISLFIWC